MKIRTKITELFNIEYPIIQGGMIWCSGHELVSAVSNNGGLGLIGGGSMRPEIFREHIRKTKKITDKPFGVNIPLIYKYSEELIKIALEEGVKIFFTSAGNPKKYTPNLKEKGCKVVHVISNVKFAKKSEEAGVDAVVAEGFEAGGHNGRDELTTMVLVPMVVDNVKIPVIAAGGIANGRQIAAALSLGAEGVQIGSRFAVTKESSASEEFKKRVVKATDTETVLILKDVIPTRLIKNEFAIKAMELEEKCASPEELKKFLGNKRAMKGIFEGDIEEGELEIGQVAGMINDIPSVSEIFDRIINEYLKVKETLP